LPTNPPQHIFFKDTANYICNLVESNKTRRQKNIHSAELNSSSCSTLDMMKHFAVQALTLVTVAALFSNNVKVEGFSAAPYVPGGTSIKTTTKATTPRNLVAGAALFGPSAHSTRTTRLFETDSSEVIESTVTSTTTSAESESKMKEKSTNEMLETKIESPNTVRRKLGSQELLMLPRQYRPEQTGNIFPQMTHVAVVTLTETPEEQVLTQALENIINTHPLLRCHVEGSGEPEKRIDLFKMVRSGNPDPETFVVPPSMSECDFGVKDVLKVVEVDGSDKNEIETSWKGAFEYNLDQTSFDTLKGPLWRLELHRLKGSSSKNKSCALVFTFNHAISDQSSANMLTDHLLQEIAAIEADKKASQPVNSLDLPGSMEECTLGKEKTFDALGGGPNSELLSFDTVKYVAGKAAEGFKSPPILPAKAGTAKDAEDSSGGLGGAFNTISGRAAGGASDEASERRSVIEHRTISKEIMSKLLQKCRQNEVTVSNALTALMVYAASDVIGGGDVPVVANATDATATTASKKARNYKVLQSLDFRRFGTNPDQCETVGCQAGSHDLMLGPLNDMSGRQVLSGEQGNLGGVWKLARDSRDQTKEFCIDTNGPQNAVRVFDFAMSISDMNNLVDLTAKSASSKGRAYTAGVTNAGVFEKQRAVPRDSKNKRSSLKTKHGRYKIEDLYYATSHARSGSLYQLSLLTINDEAKLTFHPVSPIVSRETSNQFADDFVALVEKVATDSSNEGIGAASKFLKTNGLVLATTAVGAFSMSLHSAAWTQFYNTVMEMKANMADPADFSATLNFWIFFAVGHPILQPILWISDVLHGSPGPRLADLVPFTFIAANLLFIGATLVSKQLRTALNIAALSAFITYVGAGLDGQAGLGDYNLALDDSYQGQIVKGCPAYEDVKLPSMNSFDLQKYQGKWYEHKFHDWTQFKEVYDTTLDIKLTDGGQGWIDDFGVKGPSPLSAKLSWDKSPVANGAHYFMFGRVDPNDSTGILREKGFGVEFPNYIVDVQSDPTTGEYTEAIQFQCLERGGVRVFEGINFMSRDPEMTDAQLTAMHLRAKEAGMYPYGASPEQMHRVERRPVDAPPLGNAWQTMWKAIGLDSLLELLTESIEDGGR
jgi:hypothetical protein